MNTEKRYIVRAGRDGGWVVYDTIRQKCLKFRYHGGFSVPDQQYAQKWADMWEENWRLRGHRKCGPNNTYK